MQKEVFREKIGGLIASTLIENQDGNEKNGGGEECREQK